MSVHRAYKFRFYPTEGQKVIFARTFGCVRYVYNHMLRVRTDAWYKSKNRISYYDSSALLTKLKKEPEYGWLNDVAAVPLQQSLRHLQAAFNRFFEKDAAYPTGSTKRTTQSAAYTSTAFRLVGQKLTLAKIKEPLDVKWSRRLPESAKITAIIVSKDKADRYFISIVCEDNVAHLVKNTNSVGIDLGLTHFAVLSTGEKVLALKPLHRDGKKLSKLQRRLSKKQKGSRNQAKAKLKVARLHAKIADSRKDFLHKLSTRLIRENQTIAVETLAVEKMQQNRMLSKGISDAGWSEFVRQLRYKADWYGRTLIGIGMYYPSSKRCSICGFTKSKMPLHARQWTCPECGSVHDRDINAAKNILAAGLAVSALGESVSPTQAFA